MKLHKILADLNQIEKVKFINTIDSLCDRAEITNKNVKKLRVNIDNLKQADDSLITNLFSEIKNDYVDHVAKKITLSEPIVKLVLDILSRDGNGHLRISWLETLFKGELASLNKRSKLIETAIKERVDDAGTIDKVQKYKIYYDCYESAYYNDRQYNKMPTVNSGEKIILRKLQAGLNLSDDDASAIEHMITPVINKKLDEVINTLREAGILFRKKDSIFIADEVVNILHELKNKDLKDKFIVRILRSLSDAELSNILKRYEMPIKGVSRTDKIDTIIHANISAQTILERDIHAQGSLTSARKERLKSIIDDLNLDISKLGTTLEERTSIIIDSLKACDDHEISFLHTASYNELLTKLGEAYEGDLKNKIFAAFEIEPILPLSVELLKTLSITPMDILFLFNNEEIKEIRGKLSLSNRGDPRRKILECFIDTKDHMLEFYQQIAARDYAALSKANINISESEIGVKFEDITKSIFEEIGLEVDEEIRSSVNSKREKADIIIKLSDDDIIIVEAKSFKNGDYSKYRSTSSQLKSYVSHYEKHGYKVVQALIVAPSFSNDFIEAAAMDTDINISMLEAEGLKKIREAYKGKRNPNFHGRLLTKGGLLMADRIAKQI